MEIPNILVCHLFPFYHHTFYKPPSSTLTKRILMDRTKCLYRLTISASKHMLLRVWTNRVGKDWTEYLTTRFFVISIDIETSWIFGIGIGVLWHGRDYDHFCIVQKGAFLKDDCRFKVLIICNVVSGWLWKITWNVASKKGMDILKNLK